MTEAEPPVREEELSHPIQDDHSEASESYSEETSSESGSNGEDIDGLPEWTCPECGAAFRAINIEAINEKIEHHQRDCGGPDENTELEDREDAVYILKEGEQSGERVTPPRDIEEYGATRHFHHMFTRRERPSASREIVEATLEEGWIKHTSSHERFIFEHVVGGWKWRVVVAVDEEAFYQESETHALLTIYSPESPRHEAVEKYV